jgi:dTDP-4-amino-4,6-dideoxygalactose transaminase
VTLKYPPSRMEVFRPSIGEEEIAAVADTLRSGWIGAGPKVEEFEREWAAHIGVERECVVSVNSATEALYHIFNHILLYREDIQKVLLPDNAYIGTANAIRQNGLNLSLFDIDAHTLNFKGKFVGPNHAFVTQHYGGHPQYPVMGVNTILIEDCSHAPLSSHFGKRCGTVGDFSVWSFDAMKIMTAGDGAMLYCKSADDAQVIRESTRLGMDSPSGASKAGDRWWEYRVSKPSNRAIMNDMQAALGLVQLRRLPDMVARREQIWNQYQLLLSDSDTDAHWYTLPPEPGPHDYSSYYCYWLQFPLGENRDRLAVYLREQGIYTTVKYWSVHWAYGWPDDNLVSSEWAAKHTLNLPLHANLTQEQVELICDTVLSFNAYSG